MRRAAAVLLVFMLFLTSCGAPAPDHNRITIQRNGTVQAVYVSEFPEEYNVILLEEEILDAAALFNATKEKNSVRLISVRTEQETATVEMRYSDSEAYRDFNRQVFFCGSIDDAIANGYVSGGTEVRTPDGQLATSLSILRKEEREKPYVLVALEEETELLYPGKLLYKSAGVQVDENGGIYVTPTGDEPVCLIYE